MNEVDPGGTHIQLASEPFVTTTASQLSAKLETALLQYHAGNFSGREGIRVRTASTPAEAGAGSLTGGVEPVLSSTSAQVAALLSANPAVRELVRVSGGDSTLLQRNSLELVGGGGYAEGSDQGITYKAAELGVGGNDVSIHLEAGGENESLSVSRLGKQAVVKLANNPAVNATLNLPGIKYEAVQTGVEGNGIPVTQSAMSPGQDLAVSVDGNHVTVQLATDMGDRAQATLQDKLTVKALYPGVEGNNIILYTECPNIPGQSFEAFIDGENIIRIKGATDSEGNCTTTINDLALAIQNMASHLVSVEAGLGDFTPLFTGSTLNLSGGGANFHAISPAALICGAISNDTAAAALVSAVPVSGQEPGVGSGNLSGGTNPVFTSTAEQVVTLLKADGDIQELVTVEGGGSEVVQPSVLQLTVVAEASVC